VSFRDKLLRWRIDVVPSVVFATLLVAALFYLDELRAWFSLSTPGAAKPVASAAPIATATPRAAVPPFTFSGGTLQSLRGALEAYEQARSLLADDQTEGLAEQGEAASDWFGRASSDASDAPEVIAAVLVQAGGAAEKLATSADVEAARSAFGKLSEAVVTLATSDPRLQQGWHIFECPMAKGYGKWVQRSERLENPYMGKKMLSCGGASQFEASGPAQAATISHDGHGHEGSDSAYYTCSMHPSVRQNGAGTCPICSMDLTPVTFDEEEGGVIFVDEQRRQRIGVRVGEVTRGRMLKRIRSIGKLTFDERKLVDVTLKYKGWIKHLHANTIGMRVKRGSPLFAVYSPEIYAAQGNLLTALAGPRIELEGVPADRPDPLVTIARERLALLDAYGLDKHLRKTGKPVRYITITSPASGYVVQKNVVEGSAVEAGEQIMRIAGLDTVWIEAELYEDEIPLVKEGAAATVSLSYVSGSRYEGKVTFVYPYLDSKTRTGRARIVLDNPELELKPDMYANVTIDVDLGERLRVPESAVVYTGPRRLVFIDLGEGRLKPQEVTLGLRVDDHYEVLGGLREGQRVVVSGNFLVAAESRIRSAALYWSAPDPAAPDSAPTGSEGKP